MSTGSRYSNPFGYAYAANGLPLPGALLYFYVGNSATPAVTYSDVGLTTPNSNPVVADAAGVFPTIYLDPTITYKVTQTYPTYLGGATLWTAFPVTGLPAGSATFSQATVYTQGTIGDHLSKSPYVTDAPYLADLTGVLDASAAFTSISGNGAFRVPKGTYKIATSITLSSDIAFDPGATLAIPNGVTVTINGRISAGLSQIFACSGTGAVVISRHKNYVGYPEWWGAVANDGSGGVATANAAAFQAAFVAIGKIELQASDYYVSTTLVLNTANRWLCGASSQYDSVYGIGATRVLITSATANTIQIGPSVNPGLAQFLEGIKVTGIAFARTVAPTTASACTAILVQFVLEPYFEDVRADESMIGWQFNGTVHAITHRCSAKRTSAGTGGADSWKGFYANGFSGLAAGGNASLYLSYCHADDTRAVKTNGTGFVADGKFTDCYWLHCETVSCAISMEVNGNLATSNDFGNCDMTIMHAIVDQFTAYGYYVHNLGASATVSIIEPYAGPSPGAIACIEILNNKGGAITITGGQLICGAASSCTGIVIDANGQKSGAVTVNGTIISEAVNSGVIMIGATNCRIMPIIQNDSVTGGAAIKTTGACTANYYAPTVKGKASGSTFGIQVLGTTDAQNEYNCTGIDSGTIAGGAANKLTRNGVSITAAFTLTGTNTTSGVMT